MVLKKIFVVVCDQGKRSHISTIYVFVTLYNFSNIFQLFQLGFNHKFM